MQEQEHVLDPGNAPLPPEEPENYEGFVQEDQVEFARTENTGVTIHIRGADDKPMYYLKNGVKTPVTMVVAGSHSDYYRAVEKELRQRKLNKKSFTGEFIYEDSIEKAGGCVLAWDGFFSRRSREHPIEAVRLTPHNVKQLLKRCPWVLEQVTMAMNDHASFFENGSTPPSTTSNSPQG